MGSKEELVENKNHSKKNGFCSSNTFENVLSRSQTQQNFHKFSLFSVIKLRQPDKRNYSESAAVIDGSNVDRDDSYKVDTTYISVGNQVYLISFPSYCIF